MSDYVEILWTGGWDSTFRVVELSRQDCVIQPVYVIDPGRKSTEYELSAIKNITEALKNKSETKATILPVEKIPFDKVPPNDEISKAYKIINRKNGLGAQHEWLAWLGKERPGMEMGIEGAVLDTRRPSVETIQKYGCLEYIDGTWKLNPDKSSREGMLVMGWFSFPIIKRTELEMVSQIRKWGYEDIMKLIWFCHVPIDDKPCGMCHPCQLKAECGMEWLLHEKAFRNYKLSRMAEEIADGNSAYDKDTITRIFNTLHFKGWFALFPFAKIKKGSRVVIWGVGNVGRDYVKQIGQGDYCNLVGVVDSYVLSGGGRAA